MTENWRRLRKSLADTLLWPVRAVSGNEWPKNPRLLHAAKNVWVESRRWKRGECDEHKGAGI